MGFESFPGASQEKPALDVHKKAEELRQAVPPERLHETLADLRAYLKLKQLNEVPYAELPEDLREEIGTGNPNDEFIDRVTGADEELWEMMQDAYGPDWTHKDVEQLVAELEN
jgi:hypothetical protein